VYVFRVFSKWKRITFSFTYRIIIDLPSFLKLFITLFITLIVIFKSNSKGIQKIGRLNIRKKFPQSWVFNILKRESAIPPNEEIIRHNISNVELQHNICDV